MRSIKEAFAKGKAFIPFITCGDPDLESTKKLVKSMVEKGADLIELGIPFSDPTAEGPVIMEADLRALQGGCTTEKVFQMTKELRQEVDVPFVYMTYANVVFSYGSRKFMEKAKEAGVSGLILPDVPYEEREEFLQDCKDFGIALISMVAPTSEDRIAKIAKDAEGFLYIVSSLGVTGERKEITTDLSSLLKMVKSHTDIPCAVGFGIFTREQAKEVAQYADGVIVGSAIMKKIHENPGKEEAVLGEYVASMKSGLALFKEA